MSLQKDLSQLLDTGVITRETADRIREHYRNKAASSPGRLIVVFTILGAVLVGSGVILIIAHNWDALGRTAKTLLAFLPLVAGQGISMYVLLKKPDIQAWREGSAAFLFCAVGACISLISQIYHIPGDLGVFLLTWMLLTFPLIYLLRSSVVSLLFLGGITWYACLTGYGVAFGPSPFLYWPLLGAMFVHYASLYHQTPHGNFITFHHWLVPVSMIITLGTLARGMEEFMYIAYCSLFGLFYLMGSSSVVKEGYPAANGYQVLGSLGTVILLLILSFDWFWLELAETSHSLPEIIGAPEFWVAGVLTLMAGGMFYWFWKQGLLPANRLTGSTFILFLIIFVTGLWFWWLAMVLINMLLLAIGIMTVQRGIRQDHLGILNYGLLMIVAVAICRFFDTDLSFVIRGTIFVVVGIGFFASNYRIMKKRRTHE